MKRRTNRVKHIATHIKQLRTTAPKDIRSAKALRAKMRAEAKLRRRNKQKKDEKANSGGETFDGEKAN
jgi:ribonuclease P/MRP protein subunit POP3